MEPQRNLKLILAYDGTEFHGWQRQAGVRTVQEEVEHVLRRILRHPLHVLGASRTDAGVHARGQVASVLTNTTIPLGNLRLAIGHHVPADIALVHIEEAASSFPPARRALGKLYRYRVYARAQRPVATLVAPYVWHVWYPLDIATLQAASDRLVGRHDMAGFASQGSPRATTVRTIRRFEVQRRGDEITFDVEGDGFLYNQVRNMVGTLIEIGRGHWPVERIDAILASGDRRLAGPTAPPHGLCLQWVRYPRAEPASWS
jgi:tRNA pseudouridine38-40 synthase